MVDKVILELIGGTDKALCKRLRKLARNKMNYYPSLRNVLAPRITENYSSIELVSNDQIDLTAVRRMLDSVNGDSKLNGSVVLISEQAKPGLLAVEEKKQYKEVLRYENLNEENRMLNELLTTSDTENKSLRLLVEEGNAVKRALIEQRDQTQNVIKILLTNYLNSREGDLLYFSAYFNDLADREIVDYKLSGLIQGKEFSFNTYLDSI
ncbi:hypothetical protein HY837_01490 [archaeon]|nr:hypothetical protein [archaeon]